jgi:hypothetical protein
MPGFLMGSHIKERAFRRWVSRPTVCRFWTLRKLSQTEQGFGYVDKATEMKMRAQDFCFDRQI